MREWPYEENLPVDYGTPYLRWDWGPVGGEWRTVIEPVLEKTMMVRAKMKVDSVEGCCRIEGSDIVKEGGTVRLSPVINGSPENESFYRYTPGGTLVLSTINQEAFEQFSLGQEFYIDIHSAEVVAPASREEVSERMMRWFEYNHLPDNLKAVSRMFHGVALSVVMTIEPGPERTVALRKLLEAKDAAVRAKLNPGG